jgi:small subunit ribosomal protein S20
VPIKLSAKKYLRASRKRASQNTKVKKAFREAVRKVSDLVKAGKFEDARKFMPTVQKVLDKAAKVGVIKQNTASRKKSRLVKFLKRSEK